MAVKHREVLPRQRGTWCELELPFPPTVAQEITELLKAVADPTRLTILATLYNKDRQPVCICDFTAAYELSQPTISHHMGKLREAGLVRVQKEGIWMYYRLAERLPVVVEAILNSVLD